MPILDSNETGGLIVMNVILESFIVLYNIEDSFIIGVACGKKWGLRSLKALEFEKWGLKPRSLSLIHISEPTRPY